MKKEEIREWFDKAFEHLLKGEFVSSTECFQYVIDHSNNTYAINIAQRDIEWWCTPVSYVVQRLREIPHPYPLIKIVAEFDKKIEIENQNQYLIKMQDSLKEIKIACRLDDSLWVHEEHLNASINNCVNYIRDVGKPTTLPELTQQFFANTNFKLPVTKTILSSLKGYLVNQPGIVILNLNCVFTTSILSQFSQAIIEKIKKAKNPILLSVVLSEFDWSKSVLENLEIQGLSEWLRLKGESNLFEVGSGYWYLNNLVDLSKIDLSLDFSDPYEFIETKDILRKHFFPDISDIIPSKEFQKLQTKELFKNSSVINIEQDKWITSKSFQFFLEKISSALAQSDRPKTIKESLGLLSEYTLNTDKLLDKLTKSLIEKYEQSNDIICVFGTTWIHRNAFSEILDRAYNFLFENGAHTTIEILEESLGITLHGIKCRRKFYEEFEKEILFDGRFIRISEKDHWIAIPSGNRINNLAYTILYDKHKPLSYSDLSQESRKLRGRAVRYKLSDDVRFKQSKDSRWMLTNWVLVNDFVAAYLAREKIALGENQVLQKICELHNIDISNGVFCPKGDHRFKQDPWGRWQCDSAGVILTKEMLDDLFKAASNDLEWGVSLKRLIKHVFNKPPSYFYNLEKTIIDDDRLIYCEGLWYPKELCLQSVTEEQAIQIKGYLEAKKYPVSGVELAQECLNKPICLTDLEVVLEADSEVVRIGGSGWTMIVNKPESIGRRRFLNYPIKSGKYIPSFKSTGLTELDSNNQIPSNGEIPGSNKVSQPSRPSILTLTLVFEDIRDGTIIITSKMRKFLNSSIEKEALKFIDKNGDELICWCDLENDLIYGFSDWFQNNSVGFGDKIRLSLAENKDNFFIEVMGECNEQVLKESQRRSQVEDLRNEAKLANLSYHDITLSVLDLFRSPLHIDDIWELVDHKRVAKRSTINNILSSRPYFIPIGDGYWQFDEEEYAKMITQLETQIKKLNKEKKELSDQFQAILKEESDSEDIKTQIDILKNDIKLMQRSEIQLQGKIESIEKERNSLNLKLSDRESELKKVQDELLDYQNQNKIESENLKSELRRNNEQIFALTEENQNLCKELKVENSKTKKVQEDLLSQEKKNDEICTKLEIKKAELQVAQTSSENSDILKIHAESKINELNIEMEKLKSINIKLQSELKGVSKQAAGLQDLKVELNDKIRCLEQDYNNAVSEQRSLNSELKIFAETNAKLQTQLEYYDDKIRTLENQIQNFENKLEINQEAKKQLSESIHYLEQKLNFMDKEQAYTNKIISSPIGQIAKWWVKRKN